jgi:phage shock protein A
MGIFDRMGRVISSNVNALLDKAEDPRKSIDLILAEMRDNVTLARKEIAGSLASEKQLEKKVQELDGDAERWAKRAELALKADDEALAREALVQKKRVVGDRDRAEGLLAEAKASTLKLKSELQRMEQRMADVEARKGVLTAQVQQARSGGSASESLGATGGPGGGAFDELRRIEAKLDRTEAEVAASREIDDALGGGKSSSGLSRDELEAKFASLERGGSTKKGGAEIDDELAALKQRVRIK